MSFSKSQITLAEAARAISAFWKTHSCKLIPNWTRNRGLRILKFLKMHSTYECLNAYDNSSNNNMRTLKFKSRPTNAFFAAVNQMFGGFSQLTTTAEHCFVVWTVHSDLITARSAVFGSWEEPPNIWLTVAKNAFVGWALNFRVRMLLKGAVTRNFTLSSLI